MGHARDVRVRCRPRTIAGTRVRPPHARVGSQEAPPRAGARSRRRPPDGAGAAAGARPPQGLRVRGRGRLGRGSVRVGLAVASRRRRLGDQEGDHDPRRAGRGRAAARVAEGLRRRAAAGDRYQPVARRPASCTCPAGAPGTSSSTTCPTHSTRSRPGACALGGIASRAAHPAGGQPLTGGPQMVEVSRDGKRIYSPTGSTPAGTSSSTPRASRDGWPSWMCPTAAVSRWTPTSSTEGLDGRIPHQIRLEGGDSSSDSFCFS